MKSLKFKIPSTRENVRYVEKYIENARKEYHIDEDIYGNMVVAITESVTNAIIHGNKLDSTKNVDLEMNLTNSKITIEVKDIPPSYYMLFCEFHRRIAVIFYDVIIFFTPAHFFTVQPYCLASRYHDYIFPVNAYPVFVLSLNSLYGNTG